MRTFLMTAILAMAAAACGGSTAATKPNVPVSMETARQTALARVPGTVESEELEEEDGRWVYDIDVKPTDTAKPVQEVQIDANTGAVIAVADDD